MNKLVILGVGFAAIVGCATYLMLNQPSAPPPAPIVEAPPPPDNSDQVLVAARDIPMGTVIAEDALQWMHWPKDAVSEFMISHAGKANALDDVKGSMTRVAFLRGEPIRHDKLVKGGVGGFMSAILPTGKRAVAIKIDGSGDSSAGGFILPNDRVDVVRLLRDEAASKARAIEVLTAQTVLTNVKVLAIGQNIQEENGKKVITGANATLELDPEQSEAIILAQRSAAGELHLILRSLVDSQGPTELNWQNDGATGGYTVVRYGAIQHAGQ